MLDIGQSVIDHGASPLHTPASSLWRACCVGWLTACALLAGTANAQETPSDQPQGPPPDQEQTETDQDARAPGAVRAGAPLLVPGRAADPGDKSWSPAQPPPELGPAPEPEPEPDTRSWLAKAWEKWDGEISIGLNGTEGNSDIIRIRGGGRLTRKWDNDKVSLRADYRFARDNGGESENRLDSNFRHDREAGKTGRFGYFTELDLDTDSTLDFDVRARLNTGPTLWWIRNNTSQLRTSAGLAISREFGSPSAEYIPEFTASLTASHDVTKRIKLTSDIRYDPEVERFSRYRLRSRGAVEFLIDPELKVSLRFEVENRFDSEPASATTQRNDLDYAARLVWRF